MANVEPAFGQPGIVNVSIVVLGFMSTNGFASLPYIAPGITFAVEQMQKKYGHIMNFKLDFLYDSVDRTCQDTEINAENMVSEWHYRKRNKHDITVYIESACLENTKLPYFRTQWDTLWISTVSTSAKIRNRPLYPTWISTQYFMLSACSDLYSAVLAKYNWTSIFIIIDTSSLPFFDSLAKRVITVSQARTPPVVHRINITPGAPFGKFGSVLEVARKVSRVILYFGLGPPLRELLITAFPMNMTNGEYVYIACENPALFPPIRWQYNDKDDPVALQAFRSLLIVHLSNYAHGASARRLLADEFRERSERIFNFTYPLTNQPYAYITGNCMAVTALARVCGIVNGLFDLFYLPMVYVLEVVNETLAEGGNLRSGSALARKFLNRTFNDVVCDDSMFIESGGQPRSAFSVSYHIPTGDRESFLQKDGESAALTELKQLTTWVNASFPPPNEPVCGYLHQHSSYLPPGDNQSVYVVVFTLAGLCIVIGMISIGVIRHSKWKAENQLLYGNWWQIELLRQAQSQYGSVSRMSIQQPETKSSKSHAGKVCTGLDLQMKQEGVAIHEHNSVMCTKIVGTRDPVTFTDMAANRCFLVLLKKLKAMEHMNVCRFYGITISDSVWITAVSEWPTRSALPEIFDTFVAQDAVIVYSLAMDYLDALQYIHSSPLQYHGRISGMACWIDKHFTLKVAHVAMDRLHKELATVCQACSGCRENAWECVKHPWKLQKELFSICQHHLVCTENAWDSLYWTTSEQVRCDTIESYQAGDIYSSGMVLCDLLTNGGLYHKIRSMYERSLDTVSPTSRDLDHFFSSVDLSHTPDLGQIIRSCWNREPHMRASVQSLRVAFSRHACLSAPDTQQRQALFDNIYRRLASYSSDLEQQVAIRTKELKEEMQKCDDIISQFLPRTIVKELRAGRTVSPEFFECVTVMFTDLFGFAEFVQISSPESTITLIDHTEIYIDKLSTEIRVYKVEAIGDSFMVASGLPDRCGNDHIARIASFALKLRDVEPELLFLQNLRFKTGFHSGPCAAGQMGLKKPRYCLFGDTVNMASRMCSHGLPGRIHLSPDSQNLLDDFQEFMVEPRGLLAVKGKSEMTTYWLFGKHETNSASVLRTHIL